ncbi:MAG: hypothetical protein ACM3Q4_06115 [Acidobacteriota bacterium]
MNTMFDIILSSIIGGALMLSIFAVGSNLSEVSYKNNFDYSVQLAAMDLSQMIEYDFNKIGYRTAKPAITAADSTDITFKSDITNTHTVATIRYYTGTPDDLTSTKNPNDIPMYKKLNGGTPASMYYGLTKMRFSYYDSVGTKFAMPVTAANLSKIRSIKVEAVLQSAVSFDSTYSTIYWERTFFPKNL